MPAKQIIKEFSIGQDFCTIVLRTTTYARTLDHFNNLFAEAAKDFPNITKEEVEIVHFTGERYKGMYGIEFNLPKDANIPKKYEKAEPIAFVH